MLAKGSSTHLVYVVNIVHIVWQGAMHMLSFTVVPYIQYIMIMHLTARLVYILYSM